ncbi:MAG: serine/threonine-protein kinase [Acidobacteria bacterium]|nr:serine/threonine-protein kinase [Acidobacteriota bacterium]
MPPERWQQIKALFNAAQDRAPQERTAFLRAHCVDDEELLREVNSLLAADAAAGDYLLKPALELEAHAQATDQQTALIGCQLGRYEIRDLLGVGGMGEVWRAYDAPLNRFVALKTLPLRYTCDASRLQRFIREATTASSLNHPNIITIHEIGQLTTEAGELHFIATELIEGITLRQRLDTGGRLPWREALAVAVQIATALDAAHRAGIVHRDIKPENVMVRPDGLVKVLDFGLAKLTAPATGPLVEAQTGAPVPAGQTQPGMILGTLRYMSPEQARGHTVDAHTDIFSLGAVLYELLTGQPLFAGETSADVIAAIIHNEPPPLAEVAPDAPAELERIMCQALAKKSEDRYPTVRVLQDELQVLKGSGEQANLAPLSTRANSSSAVIRWRAPRFALWQMALLPLLVLCVVGALWWWKNNRSGQLEAPLPSSLKITEVHNWASTPGEVYSEGKISPDGNWVAFTSTEGGRKNVWYKLSTGAGKARPCTDDEFNNDEPIWSPDSKELAFISWRGGTPGLWRISMTGGMPALLKKSFDDGANAPRLKYWSKNGLIYYESKQNLFAFEISSGRTENLTKFGSGTTDKAYFSPSPDGQRIAYVASLAEGHSVMAVATNGEQPKRVASLPVEIRNTVWHPDNQRIFFSAKINGVFQIFVGDLAGHQPVQLTLGETDSLVLDVSTDRKSILFGTSKETSDLWGVNKTKAQEFVVASDINVKFWPTVSPDSRVIAYQSVRGVTEGGKIINGSNIVTQSLGSALPNIRINNGFLPQWSPDGKSLAFMRRLNNAYNIWAISAQGGAERQITQAGCAAIGNTIMPAHLLQTSYYAWSPDSNKLAYLARRNGQRNLWLINADGSNDTLIPTVDDSNWVIDCPLWSADGKRIAWSAWAQDKKVAGKISSGLWVTELETKTTKPVYQTDYSLQLIGWSQAEEFLIFSTHEKILSLTRPALVTLHNVSVVSKAVHSITTLFSTYFLNLHLSPDRRTLAYVARQDDKDNLWLVSVQGGKSVRLTTNPDPHLYFSNLAWAQDSQSIYFGKQARYSQLFLLDGF